MDMTTKILLSHETRDKLLVVKIFRYIKSCTNEQKEKNRNNSASIDSCVLFATILLFKQGNYR